VAKTSNDKIKSGNIPGVNHVNTPVYYLLAIIVGLVAGFGAVAFRGMIAGFHNLLFLGKLSFFYDANKHTPANPWGIFIILIPVLGALGVVFLVKNFAPEAKGHGVPEVMDAIYYAKGKIRPIVAVIKSLASAISIGSGGSIGREGPIIQIGSSFGSTLGQVLKLAPWQRITLIAAGAGGGIAATFNTPIGGVLFAVEILLLEISVRTLVPVAISTVTATYIGEVFFGAHPSFIIPQFEKMYFHLTNPWVLITYVGLGLLMGLVSAVYIKSIYGFEDFFDRYVKGGYYVRHLCGMLLVGIIMYILWSSFGHYYIEGVGYATVQDVLSGALKNLPLLLLLFVLKLISTSLTLGSGASGGIFSPGLFMGATLGGAYGIVLSKIIPSLGISPAAFAVAGMAGVIGGSTGAAMAAIVMIFEMTLDYTVIIPMTITVALSYGIRKMLSPQSIYTLKLARRGHYMPSNFMTNFHLVRIARDVMSKDFSTIPASTPIGDFVHHLTGKMKSSNAVVEEAGKILGTIERDTALKRLVNEGLDKEVRAIVDKNFVEVTPDVKLLDIVELLRAREASVALVLDDLNNPSIKNVVGIITKDRIVDVLEESFELIYE
jgi:CIC family chloride channel protein